MFGIVGVRALNGMVFVTCIALTFMLSAISSCSMVYMIEQEIIFNSWFKHYLLAR